jgi:Skp family chaperone for outer membrane proteins
MKGFRLFTKTLTIALIFSTAAFAQTETAQTVPTPKIVYVNSEAFYGKENGITELVEIYGRLRAEFQPKYNELKALGEQIMALDKEIKKYYELYGIKVLKEKIAEYESLIDKYKTKEAVAKYLYERRAAETIDVVKKQIARFADSFAAEKGYVLILDISKSNGTFTFSDSGNSDVTIDFIKYCNENFAKAKI